MQKIVRKKGDQREGVSNQGRPEENILKSREAGGFEMIQYKIENRIHGANVAAGGR